MPAELVGVGTTPVPWLVVVGVAASGSVVGGSVVLLPPGPVSVGGAVPEDFGGEVVAGGDDVVVLLVGVLPGVPDVGELDGPLLLVAGEFGGAAVPEAGGRVPDDDAAEPVSDTGEEDVPDDDAKIRADRLLAAGG